MTDGVDEGAEQAPAVEAEVAAGQATDQDSSPPSNPKWDAYLTEHEVPEPAQNYVREALRHFDGNVTKKFQEHAEYRSRWEPYEQIAGFDQWTPEQLAQALPIMAALDDEDQALEVVQRMAVHLGLLSDDEDDELYDGDAELEDEQPDGPPAWFREQFEPVQQFVQLMQEREKEQSAQAYIDQSFATIETELGRKLTDDEKSDVQDRAEGYARRGDQDPIASAWDAHKGFRTRVEREFIGRKRDEPGRAEVGHSAPPGQPDLSHLSLEDRAQHELKAQIAALSGN